MLQRGSSDAAQRLRRAKSTTSIPRRRNPRPASNSDPVAGQKIALTAATRAFERAAGVRRSESDAEVERVARSQSARVSRKSTDGFRVARQQSSGGNKKSCRSPIRTINRQSNVRKATSSCQLTPTSQKTSTISAENRRSPGTDASAPGNDGQFAERFDGYGRQNAIRLRKTQSSYACTRSQRSFEVHSPSLRYPQSQRTSQNRLRDPAPSIRDNQTDEAIIALARDQYLKEHQIQPLQSKRSYLSASLRSRFRKTKRSSGQSSDPLYQARENILESGGSVESTAKSAQKLQKHNFTLSSIKKGWRRAFGKSSGTSEVFAQQVDATKARYDKPIHHPYETSSNNPSLYNAGTENWMRDEPPTPPPHLVGLHGLPPSIDKDHGSIKYSDASNYDRSRVTSWNDSTRQSTMVLREMNHLPSIDERPDLLDNGSVVSHQTERRFKIPTHRSSSNFSMKASLDSRRLIAALMKHTKLKSSDIDNPGLDPSSELITEDGPDLQEHNSTLSSLNRGVPFIPREFSSNSSSRMDSHQPDHHLSNRESVVSPSVYSERLGYENSSSIDRSSSPDGVATVIGSRAIGRWHVGERMADKQHVTSSEWRSWAAEESAGLDKSKEFTLPVFSPQFQQTPAPERHDAASSRQTSIASERVWNSVEIRNRSGNLGNRLSQFTTKTSLMNDRFPMLGTGRTASKTSLTSSRRTSSSKIGKMSDKDRVPILDQKDLATFSRNSRPLSICKDSTPDKSPIKRALAEEPTAEESNANASSVASRTQQQLSSSPSHGQPPKARIQCTDRGSPLVKRGPNTGVEDNFLLRIRKGPYGTSSSSLIKVNTSSMESIRLPKRQSPALSLKSKENSPPSRGQQMANEFLSSRASKTLDQASGSSPAFL